MYRTDTVKVLLLVGSRVGTHYPGSLLKYEKQKYHGRFCPDFTLSLAFWSQET
ncbi:MAG: hypothetical protein WB014_06975 [Methanosarcina sp.]